jgi:hypothetical protein
MPANPTSLHLVDVCDNRISTETFIRMWKRNFATRQFGVYLSVIMIQI